MYHPAPDRYIDHAYSGFSPAFGFLRRYPDPLFLLEARRPSTSN